MRALPSKIFSPLLLTHLLQLWKPLIMIYIVTIFMVTMQVGSKVVNYSSYWCINVIQITVFNLFCSNTFCHYMLKTAWNTKFNNTTQLQSFIYSSDCLSVSFWDNSDEKTHDKFNLRRLKCDELILFTERVSCWQSTFCQESPILHLLQWMYDYPGYCMPAVTSL